MTRLEITVLNRQRAHPVGRRALSSFLERVAREVQAPQAGSIAVSLVSERRMSEYNRRFRGQRRPTDVLSFPAGAPLVPDEPRHLGDIVISVPTAVRQARNARHSLERELKILAVHGYLHLLGYDHEVDDGTMMRLQRKLLRRLLPADEGTEET